MSVADKITRLTTARNNIRTALNNKGADATEHGFEDFAEDINGLSGESSLPSLDNITFGNNPTVPQEGKTASANYEAIAQAIDAVAARQINAVVLEPLTITMNGTYIETGKAYNSVTVNVNPDIWVRPSNWPNLDVLTLSDSYSTDIYMTYDLTKVEWPPFIAISDNGGDGILERGHIANNTFITDETYSRDTWATQRSYLDTTNGDIQIFHYYGTKNPARFGWCGFNNYSCVHQPCVEIIGKFNNELIYSSKNTDTNPNLSLGYLERIKISGTIKSWNGMFAYCKNLQKIDFNNLDLSSMSMNNSPFQYCMKLKKVDFQNTVVADTGLFFSLFQNNSIEEIDFKNSKIRKFYVNAAGVPLKEIYIQDIAASEDFSVANALYLSVASLRRILTALESTEDTRTLTLGTTHINKLTAEEIAVATEKGWTVA